MTATAKPDVAVEAAPVEEEGGPGVIIGIVVGVVVLIVVVIAVVVFVMRS
jgi:hypothetical protein